MQTPENAPPHDDERPAAQGRAPADDRSVFERFVHGAQAQVSSSWFFYACLALVLGWLVSVPLWSDLKSWQAAIHTVTSLLTLLLLALLENAGRRGEEAAQEKLNVLAEALAALMASRAVDDPDLLDAAERLRTAVGLEERH